MLNAGLRYLATVAAKDDTEENIFGARSRNQSTGLDGDGGNHTRKVESNVSCRTKISIGERYI